MSVGRSVHPSVRPSERVSRAGRDRAKSRRPIQPTEWRWKPPKGKNGSFFFCVTGGVFFALLLRIHGSPVADSRAGAVMQKLLRIQCDGRTDRRTDLPTNTARCRIACPRLKIRLLECVLNGGKIQNSPWWHCIEITY